MNWRKYWVPFTTISLLFTIVASIVLVAIVNFMTIFDVPVSLASMLFTLWLGRKSTAYIPIPAAATHY